MSDQPPRSFAADFKLFFLRGLVVVLPSVLTLWIVVKAYQFVDSTIAEPINHGIRLAMHNLAPVWSPLSNAFDHNRATRSFEELGRIIAAKNVGDLVKVRARRNGRYFEVTIRLTALRTAEAKSTEAIPLLVEVVVRSDRLPVAA